MSMRSINPATGEALQEFTQHSADRVEQALARAVETFPGFSPRAQLDQRLKWLARTAEILERDQERLALVITAEMGKPIVQSIAEIEKCAKGCRYYVENAARILEDQKINTENTDSYVRWLPIGAVLAVMPWNFPFWQVIRFAAPALAAGNVGLLKHASNVPQCALAIEQILTEAGFPAGAFQTLLIPSSAVANVIADERIRAVTLTGSEGAGAKVAQQAGACLKKTVLELGGSDPFIVMPTADLEKAVATAARSRTLNTGQSCIAAKRFIVHADIHDRFVEQLVAAFKKLKIGNPMDKDTDIGPLATAQIRDDLVKQVEQTIAMGARAVVGGQAVEGPGYFYPQTVLVDIPEDSPAWQDEMFGPVASVFPVAGVDDAIKLANATRFGLGSAAWTNDADEQARFIDGIDAGFTAINGMTASDPRLPFGGVKSSGHGRELSDLGMREFLNAKTITRA